MLRLVGVVLILLLPALAVADSALETDLQGIVDRYLAENPLAPGVLAHVVCPGLGLDHSFAAGTVDHSSDVPLTDAHTFRIASNTKTYMAAALLRLVEMDRLELDDPLGPHLSAERRALLAADGYDLETITIAQVLSHTAGLAEHPADPRFAEMIYADPQRVWTADEQVRLMVEWCDPVGPPGGRYQYSDTGYVLLGGIIEGLADRPLGVAVHELLDYERLGLNVTWWEYTERPPGGTDPRAHQYIGDHDIIDWNASFDLFGGGGLVTDAPDLALFMRLLLQGGVLCDDATLTAMTGGGTAPYRLGLMSMELGGHVVFGHQGFWNTFAFHVPVLDLTVSGCSLNHDAVNAKELAAALIERVAEARRSS